MDNQNSRYRAAAPRTITRIVGIALAGALSITLALGFGAPAQAAAKSSLSLVVSTTLVDSGKSATATATLKRGSSVLKSAPVLVQKRQLGTAKWYKAGAGRTGPTGKFSVKLAKMSKNLELRAVYSGTKSTAGSISASKPIKVRQQVRITSSSSSTPVSGSKIQLRGTTTPGLAGLRVIMEKRVGNGWLKVSHATVSSSKKFTLKATAGKAGVVNYRVRVAATKSTLAARSATKKFTVYQWFGLENIKAVGFVQGNPITRPLLTGTMSIQGVKRPAQVGKVYSSDRFSKESNRTWKLNGSCTRFIATAGIDDTKYDGKPLGYASFDADKMEMGETEVYHRLSPTVSQKFDVRLRGSRVIRLGFSNASVDEDGSWGVAGFASPRVLCSVSP